MNVYRLRIWATCGHGDVPLGKLLPNILYIDPRELRRVRFEVLSSFSQNRLRASHVCLGKMMHRYRNLHHALIKEPPFVAHLAPYLFQHIVRMVKAALVEQFNAVFKERLHFHFGSERIPFPPYRPHLKKSAKVAVAGTSVRQRIWLVLS